MVAKGMLMIINISNQYPDVMITYKENVRFVNIYYDISAIL